MWTIIPHCDKLHDTIEEIENDSDILFHLMKLNTSRRHILMIPNITTCIKIGKHNISRNNFRSLIIDNKLNFEPHVENLSGKAANKLQFRNFYNKKHEYS